MMKISYDPKGDASVAWFAPEGIMAERTEEVAPEVFVDFDADGGDWG